MMIPHHMRPALLLTLAAAALTACGQRGDLYLPEPAREAVPATPAASPAATAASTGDDAAAEERRRREAAGGAAGN